MTRKAETNFGWRRALEVAIEDLRTPARSYMARQPQKTRLYAADLLSAMLRDMRERGARYMRNRYKRKKDAGNT